MKKLLENISDLFNKILDNLAFSKFKRYKLTEFNCFDHLNNMIHNLLANFKEFKYNVFLVELRAIKGDENQERHIYVDIPFLIDCDTKDNVIKVIENITKALMKQEYFVKYNPDTNITLLNEKKEISKPKNLEEEVARIKELNEYQSLIKKLNLAQQRVGESQYFLSVDILKGDVYIKNTNLLVDSKEKFPAVKISISQILD